jgi:CHAD domain-containing protein
VRKRAGKVRDIDVLVADLLTLKQDGEQDCLVQLLEYLGAEREKCVKKLHSVVESVGRKLRRDLKRNSKRVEALLKEAETSPGDSDAMVLTIAKAVKLSSDLNSFSRLTKNNLHRYRLKVKELRDVFQLSKQPGNSEFLEELGDVKDAIGDWHDWEQLVGIAADALDHGSSCKLIKDMKKTAQSKYRHALLLTRSLRSHYLKARATTPRDGNAARS